MMIFINMDEEKVRQLIREELSDLLRVERYTFQKHLQVFDGRNIIVGTGTGTKIGTETTQKLGFYGVAPVVQVAVGADFTNGVTSGGSDNQTANYTDLTTYANDSGTIRNNIYQLGRSVALIQNGLRDLGLLS